MKKVQSSCAKWFQVKKVSSSDEPKTSCFADETLRTQDAFVCAKSILGEVIYLNLAVLLLERMVSFFFLSFFLA